MQVDEGRQRCVKEQWNESAFARQYSVPCWDCPVLRMLGKDALGKCHETLTFVYTWQAVESR